MNILSLIERAGNRLPHPASLFFLGLCCVMALSWLAFTLNWSVIHPASGVNLSARNLISRDGAWWLLSHLVDNFIKFPPLAIVLVGMLGIGMAERTGLLSTILRLVIARTPQAMLTPVTLFLGIMSSLAVDAGYVVLPPIAAALYLAAGRSPLVGIAVAFAGVSAGFSANLFITAIDPLLAGFTQSAATILVPDYQVPVTANWWFMITSTLVLTLTGWGVTTRWVEPLSAYYPADPAAAEASVGIAITAWEIRALYRAFAALLLTVLLILLWIFLPEGVLHGEGNRFARWIEATVPLLFLVFVIPAIVFGVSIGNIRNDKDIADMMGATIAALGPYIVLAFFAAQFIEAFKYSGLGEMLAISGGLWLASLALPSPVLLSSFLTLAMLANLFIGSSSAKYAFLAPVFVPMLMLAGFSPELTQAAYRVGDSVTNVITPLNPYMIIVLAFVQQYAKKAGMGTLIAMMLPYTIAFALIWSLLLVGWLLLDIPLGPGGNLAFEFTQISS
ncbi:MAG: AbgT family transporter [Nitrosomonas sp.]|nr:AbgT family transporter [Nitrosomonas sp.]